MQEYQAKPSNASVSSANEAFLDFYFDHAITRQENLCFGHAHYDDRGILDNSIADNLLAHIYFRLTDLGFSHESFLITPRVAQDDDRMKFLGSGAESTVYLRQDLGRVDKFPSALRNSISHTSERDKTVVNTHFDALINSVKKAVQTRATAKLLGIESLNPYVTPDGVYHEQLLPEGGKEVLTSRIFSTVREFHQVQYLRFGKEFFWVDQFNPSGHILQYEEPKRLILIDGVSASRADLEKAKNQKHRDVLERLNTEVDKTLMYTLNQVERFLTPFKVEKKASR